MVWIDCEMTGLDLDRDALVEVAIVVTDGDLQPLDAGLSVVIRPPSAALEGMSDFVRTMHEKSGLLPLLDDGMDLTEAEAALLAYLTRHVPEARKAPLAGNSIGTDRAFLQRHMPVLEGHLHYRNVDVSSIKELARRWLFRTYLNSPSKSGNHRALADILESIEELRYYREAAFVSTPGLSSSELRTIAARHGGALTGQPNQDPSE